MTPQVAPAGEPEQGRWWWVHLVAGVAWLLFGFAILNGREEITTVWTVAVFAGLLFSVFAIVEFASAVFVEGWRWLNALLSLCSAIAAIFCFAWPGQTFLTLAAITGWYLLATGVLHIALGYGARDTEDVWWVGVLVGIGEILLAFWAIGYPGRSIRLMLLWIAAAALARGLLRVITAFSLRSARRTPAAV